MTSRAALYLSSKHPNVAKGRYDKAMRYCGYISAFKHYPLQAWMNESLTSGCICSKHPTSRQPASPKHELQTQRLCTVALVRLEHRATNEGHMVGEALADQFRCICAAPLHKHLSLRPLSSGEVVQGRHGIVCHISPPSFVNSKSQKRITKVRGQPDQNCQPQIVAGVEKTLERQGAILVVCHTK